MRTAVREKLEARLASVQSRIAALEASIGDSTPAALSSTELDTGEGRQKLVWRNPTLISKEIDKLYATEEWLVRRLNGQGITNVRRRRKS